LLTNTRAGFRPTPNVLSSNSNLPDSSASFHVTGENHNIHQNTPNESLEKIYPGNGQGLPIQSSGSSYFSAPNNPNISLSLHLRQVFT